MNNKSMVLLAVLLINTLTLAQEHGTQATAPATAGAQAHSEPADPNPHPVLSTDSTWSGTMVILTLGLFLAAAGVGMAVRANMPEEAPPDHAGHDEHGAGHHDAHASDAHGHGH